MLVLNLWLYSYLSLSNSGITGVNYHAWSLYTLSSIKMLNYGEGHTLPSTDDLLVTTVSILIHKPTLDLVYQHSRMLFPLWQLFLRFCQEQHATGNISYMLTQHWMNERSLKFCFFIFPGWHNQKTEGRIQTQVSPVWSYDPTVPWKSPTEHSVVEIVAKRELESKLKFIICPATN